MLWTVLGPYLEWSLNLNGILHAFPYFPFYYFSTAKDLIKLNEYIMIMINRWNSVVLHEHYKKMHFWTCTCGLFLLSKDFQNVITTTNIVPINPQKPTYFILQQQ